MRWAYLVVLGCGCNQILGVSPTVLYDAPPPVDAAPAPFCAPLGTPLTFGTELHQLPARGCTQYTPSRDNGTAIALCNGTISSGPIDHELSAITLAPAPPTSLDEARLSPEGDRLVVTDSAAGYEVREYLLGADGTWSSGGVGNVGVMQSFSTFSSPSRSPDRRAVYSTYDLGFGSNVLVELVETASGTWQEMTRYDVAELGVADISQPSLSADGLRLVFVGATFVPQPIVLGGQVTGLHGAGLGTTGTNELGGGGGGGTGGGGTLTTGVTYDSPVYYADRETTASHFRVAQPLPTVPSFVSWPFVTEDCGRIYFSALGTVFYLKQ